MTHNPKKNTLAIFSVQIKNGATIFFMPLKLQIHRVLTEGLYILDITGVTLGIGMIPRSASRDFLKRSNFCPGV
jgi:hypothetical protein